MPLSACCSRRPRSTRGLLALLAVLLPVSAAAQTPSLAVLPFRAYSAQPIDYLGESLANLVRSRLAESGRVTVLEAATVEAQLDPSALGESRIEALREIAGALGTDYVVSGSLTELAGRYSLDVRVTAAAPGVPGHTLVVTAERDEELLDRVGEIAEGILEHVVGVMPAVVAKVSIEGGGPLGGELAPQLVTRSGEPYDPAHVRDDLALLRSHPGVSSASVETERGDDGVAIRFRISRADQVTTGKAAPGELVVEVLVRGNRRIESAAILARVGTRPGSPFRRAQVTRDVREVNSLGFFRNVRVFAEQTPKGLVVTFEVEENPVVRQISISGNDNVDSDKIRDLLTLTTGATLDYPLLFENRERIGALYRAEGYYLAEVDYEVEPLSEHAVGVHFMVDEGKKLKLRTIVFEGNEFFDNRELVKALRTKRWRFWSYLTSWFDKSGTYSEPLFLQDLQNVRKMYADSGFLQAEVGEPLVIPEPDGLEVKIKIVEGRRYRVGDVEIAGDDSLDTVKLEEDLALKEGDWFNQSLLAESVQVLTSHYADRGFFYANVDVVPLSDLDSASEAVNVVFQVRKGPLYFIREIDIAGNTRTVDPVVRREMRLVEGQLYSQRAVMISQARIQQLGFFEEVDLRMEPTEVPEQLDLEVQVVERPTGSFSFGAGYSSQDGFVVTGSLAQSNLFGRGYEANASVDFGGQTQRFFASLTDPYFLGSEFSLGLTGFSTQLNFEDFEQEQTGGQLVLGHSLSEDNRKRGFLRYRYARRRLVDQSSQIAASLIQREFVSGTQGTSLTGLSFVSDTRDDRFAPRSGSILGLTVEGAGLIGFAQFLRFEGRALFFLGAPSWLPERSTFVVGTRMGYQIPFNSIASFDLPEPVGDLYLNVSDGNLLPLDQIDTDLTLPLSERYFLGGLGEFQLRGYKARSVGPRRPILIDEGVSLRGSPTNTYIPVGRAVAFVNDDGESWPGGPPDFDENVPPVPPDNGQWELSTICVDGPGGPAGGNGNGKCNTLNGPIVDIDETDVIGGSSFISNTLEYRFPISETLGLQGVVFLDFGNAFKEGDLLFDVTEWRYGTGVGIQWFSPFGPLALVLGFPLNRDSEIEKSPVFEFSVGGQEF